jgi:heme exporter protein D
VSQLKIGQKKLAVAGRFPSSTFRTGEPPTKGLWVLFPLLSRFSCICTHFKKVVISFQEIFMCFSAEASFTGSAVITAIGIATLVRVRKPEQVPFAGIPIIFGVQQCAEGVLWITLKSGGYENLQNIAAYVFLITALIIWPTMIPLCIWLIEKAKKRRTILGGIMAAGGIVSIFYIVCLVRYSVSPQIQGFHIEYIDNFPYILVKIAFVLYLIATITPLFVSSYKRMWLFGVFISISCLVTGIIFEEYLTSVWCFFAACISIVIYWVMNEIRNKTDRISNSTQTAARKKH